MKLLSLRQVLPQKNWSYHLEQLGRVSSNERKYRHGEGGRAGSVATYRLVAYQSGEFK
jgi:hypothetical protein